MQNAGRSLPKMGKFSRVAWSLVLSGVLVGGTCWLNAADEAPQTGLRGILPNMVPAELSGTIATLPENWTDWGTAVSSELATLYEAEDADITVQRKAIAVLRKRQAVATSYAADPRYKSILNLLVSLSGGLKRRLDIAEAALETLEKGPEQRAAKVSAASQRVVQQAQALDTYLGKIKNGSGWNKYLAVDEVRTAVAEKGTEEAAVSLAAVQGRLKEKNSLADAKAREFLSKPQFAAYEEAVDEYLSAIAVPEAAANNPELRKRLAELVSALEDFESTHSTASALATRKAFDATRMAAPDGAEALSLAMRDNYFNYNLRIVASEAYLNKYIGQIRNESGGVVDNILGAYVTGSQSTQTTVSIDLVPSGGTAQFDIKATGAVASNTAGATDQATVYTYGNHHFVAAKRIVFDGEKFSTRPARINVSAHNQTTGADMHTFLGIGRGIAMNRAEELRGQSESIAASRVQERVLPPFNTEVDKEFRDMNPDVARRLQALRELNLYPDAKSWSSTDSELKLSSRLMTNTELSGGEPNPALYLGRGLNLLMHDTMLNASADRLEFAGQEMTDAQIKAKLEAHLSKLLDREVKFSEDETPAPKDDSGIKTIVFDKVDPLRIHADDGQLFLTIRAGFKQEDKEDIPTQIITVPLKFTVTMENVVIEPGDFSISAAEEQESPAKQLVRAGVIKKKLASALPRRELKRVKRMTHKQIKVVTAVTRIRALDGWLSITFE